MVRDCDTFEAMLCRGVAVHGCDGVVAILHLAFVAKLQLRDEAIPPRAARLLPRLRVVEGFLTRVQLLSSPCRVLLVDVVLRVGHLPEAA